MNNSNLQRSDSVLPTPAADTSPAKPRKRRWASVLVHTLVWGYLLLLIGAGMLIRRDGERWWFATLVLFGPAVDFWCTGWCCWCRWFSCCVAD